MKIKRVNEIIEVLDLQKCVNTSKLLQFIIIDKNIFL